MSFSHQAKEPFPAQDTGSVPAGAEELTLLPALESTGAPPTTLHTDQAPGIKAILLGQWLASALGGNPLFQDNLT